MYGQAQGGDSSGAQTGAPDLTKGEEYTDQGQDYYEERYRERVLSSASFILEGVS